MLLFPSLNICTWTAAQDVKLPLPGDFAFATLFSGILYGEFTWWHETGYIIPTDQPAYRFCLKSGC